CSTTPHSPSGSPSGCWRKACTRSASSSRWCPRGRPGSAPRCRRRTRANTSTGRSTPSCGSDGNWACSRTEHAAVGPRDAAAAALRWLLLLRRGLGGRLLLRVRVDPAAGAVAVGLQPGVEIIRRHAPPVLGHVEPVRSVVELGLL